MEQSDNNPTCPECKGLRGGHANRRCSLMTLEYAQEEIIRTEQRWLKVLRDHRSVYQKTLIRLKRELAFFQGKVSVLKHENNKLRKPKQQTQ